MSWTFAVACIALAAGIAAVPQRASAQARIEMPNDVSGEFLGKGLLYSVSYQRMVSRSIGLEVGIEVLGAGLGHQIIIPIGAKFYFRSGGTSPFAAAGIGIHPNVGLDALDDDAKLYSYTGVGIEHRSDNGFVIRGAVYGVFAGRALVWPALSVGYAF